MRGDVYRIRADKRAAGREQTGPRYAVVIQSDDLPLSTWVVAPTSTGRAAASFRPEITIAGEPTRVLVEQMLAVDPEVRLGDRVGHLALAEMQAIDTAVRVVLGLA